MPENVGNLYVKPKPKKRAVNKATSKAKKKKPKSFGSVFPSKPPKGGKMY